MIRSLKRNTGRLRPVLIRIISYTEKGKCLCDKIESILIEHVFEKIDASDAIISDSFYKRIPLVFICASGIAVRKISPFVNSKMTDCPVIVIDDNGKFVIPILSGHVGGGNVLAEKIAMSIDAIPVVTTATDVNDSFSVDLFALKNGLKINDKQGIKLVSSRILGGERISVYIEEGINTVGKIPECLEIVDEIPENETVGIAITRSVYEKKSLINLTTKNYCLGIGCKKDKSFEDIKNFIESNINGIILDGVFAVSSIDLKKKEKGLCTFSQSMNVPFITFPEGILSHAEGVKSNSDFVRKTTGVGCVCESSALVCAGEGSRLVLEKISYDGMTVAVAERKPAINWSYQ